MWLIARARRSRCFTPLPGLPTFTVEEGVTVDAGMSAAAEAQLSERIADAHRRAATIEGARAAAFRVGGRGEQCTAAALDRLRDRGFVVLHDRRWPGTRRSNLDHLAVGPSGVFVIDSKAWSGPLRVAGGVLFAGDDPREDEVDKVLDQAVAVEEVLAEDGLAPLEVVPVMAFPEASGVSERIGRVHLVSVDCLPVLLARGERLTGDQVHALARRLEEACPPAAESGGAPSALLPPVVAPYEAPQEETLFDEADLDRAQMDAAAQEPIESWMAFLHPNQVRFVRRAHNGPSRIRGAAGTGKTVVGLHRAAYLAASKPGPVLFTTFVRTLPPVLERLYRRLAPDTADRVEFTGLHRWARCLLADRGAAVPYDPGRARTRFYLAFASWRGRDRLVTPTTPVDYWLEEIDSVVKGRGLTHFEQYAGLARTGRRTRLPEQDRELVWELHTAYDERLRQAGIVDHNDLLAMALRSVEERPVEPRYAAVIADEVQDLNLLGARLLHALAGDAPDGLTLIGDGQQAIYPGGYTLAEAGISVGGRATVLRVNYRNTRAILDYATGLIAADEFADLDPEPERGRRDVDAVREGPEPEVVVLEADEHDDALLAALSAARAEGTRLGDMAVLAPTNALAGRFARVLRGHGYPTVSLHQYDGERSDRVKVGTVKRAKGLEFAQVFLPAMAPQEEADDTDEAARERLERERRERFVAMTRARDRLWIATVKG